MNTLGLKRRVNTFGLGKLTSYFGDVYHEIVKIMLTISTKFEIKSKL